MWSNGPGVQPKPLSSHQTQFNELLSSLSIPLSLSPTEKLTRLRAVPLDDLIRVQDTLSNSEFRALSDGVFVNENLIADINSGRFAAMMRERNVRVLNGECEAEHAVYGSWRPPQNNTYDACQHRLAADYPLPGVQKLMRFLCPQGKLPKGTKDWTEAFGHLYAAMQVHSLERGFVAALARGGCEIGTDVLRYRIEWRARCCDAMFPREWGVTHGTDMAIWFWGNGWADGLTEDEKRVVGELQGVFGRFVRGEEVEWRRGERWVRRLRGDGGMDWWEDERWEEGVRVWELVNPVLEEKESAKL